MPYSHREYCKLVTEWLIKQSWCDIACWELKYKRGFVDAIGISKPAARNHRVTVVEVKRARGDLLQDLRANKYMKYQPGSTHCYLAANADALALGKKDMAEVIKDLRNKGFPDHWGILLFGPRGSVSCVRRAKTHSKTTIVRIRELTRQIARSLCYKAIKGTI